MVTRIRLCFIKPLSLTLGASGRFGHKMFTIKADRTTHQCERLQTPYMAFGDLDPSIMMAPNGMGLVSLLMPTLPDEAQGQVYDYAGGFKALNSSFARGCL